MQEMLKQYGQGIMVAAEKTKGMGKAERGAVKKLARLSKTGDEEEEEVQFPSRVNVFAIPPRVNVFIADVNAT